jgi:hypothetical protein
LPDTAIIETFCLVENGPFPATQQLMDRDILLIMNAPVIAFDIVSSAEQ